MIHFVADFKFFWEAFVTLVVITDPPGVVPVFLGMTSTGLSGSGTGWRGKPRWSRSG